MVLRPILVGIYSLCLPCLFINTAPLQIEPLLVPNLYLNQKYKIMLFAKRSYIGGCQNSVDLSVLTSEEVLETRKAKICCFVEVFGRIKKKRFWDNLGQHMAGKFIKWDKIIFFMKKVQGWFFATFSWNLQNSAHYAVAFSFNHVRIFLKVSNFPKIQIYFTCKNDLVSFHLRR